MDTDSNNPVKDKHLLIAVDESDSSRRAVLYVADLLGGFPGFTVTLLRIIPAPEKDFFETAAEQDAWVNEKLDGREPNARELPRDPDPVRLSRGKGARSGPASRRRAPFPKRSSRPAAI